MLPLNNLNRANDCHALQWDILFPDLFPDGSHGILPIDSPYRNDI